MNFYLPIIILATNYTNEQVGLWVVIAILFLHAAVAGKSLFTKSPTHAELATKQELQKFVRVSQFNEYKAEARGDVKEIKAMINKSMDKVEEYAEKSYGSRQRIHEKLNGVDKEQGKLATRQNEQEKQINKLQNNA